MATTMTDDETDVTFQSSDFDAIEAAVMETARGRWFLREFAKRNRHADTAAILDELRLLRDETLPGRAVRVMDYLHQNLAGIGTGLEEARLALAETEGNAKVDRVLKNLRHLEARLAAMIAICDPADEGYDTSVEPSRLSAPPAILM